ncbi:MAG: lasso peptide biosynthesis B2 protein [Gaiellaceae bacterium]
MLGWSVALPLLKRVLPLKSLVRLMWIDDRGERVATRERQIARISAVVTRLRLGRQSNCLERSLLAYRYLSAAGAGPTLVIGVNTLESGIVGHAWVTVDGRPVHDTHADLAQFVPLTEFGARGEATSGTGDTELVDDLRVWQ